MKLYSRYSILFIVLAVVKCLNTAGESAAQLYPFTIENKLSNKKVYAALYEQFGKSRWKQVATPHVLDPLKSHTFNLSKENVSQKKYLYAVAAEKSAVLKDILTEREKDALEAKLVAGQKVLVNHMFFSAKNPLEFGTITVRNDSSTSWYIARYIMSPLEKNLNVTLASSIAPCGSKMSLTIPIPIGHQAFDVVLVAAHTSDALTASLNLKDILHKKNFLVTRRSFKAWKDDALENSYTVSTLFAKDELAITNDTTRNWQVCLYAAQDQQRLQKVSDVLFCKAGQKAVYDKKALLPIVENERQQSLWVLFDHDAQKMDSSIQRNHTLHGGRINRHDANVRLSTWFSEKSDKKVSVQPIADTEQRKEEALLQEVQEHASESDSLGTSDDDASDKQKKSPFQEALKGSLEMQVSNATSKDIFVALYKKDKKQYARREKPIKIVKKKSAELGVEEDELLAYTVSAGELMEQLSSREWNTLNSQDSLKLLHNQELKIKEDMFEDDSFNLIEIAIQNNSYNDIAIGRYEQNRPGKIVLAGIVQKIPKKEDAAGDGKAEEKKSDFFALPHNYKGFIGYQNSYSDNYASDSMDASIDTTYAFERNHVVRIDAGEKKSFDAEKDFNQPCIVVQNDFDAAEKVKNKKWICLYTTYDSNIGSAVSLNPGDDKKFIPYYENMKLIVKDDYFDATLPHEMLKPYNQLLIDKHTQYYLQNAEEIGAQKKEEIAKPTIKKPITKAQSPQETRIRQKVEQAYEERKQYQPSLEIPVEIQEEGVIKKPFREIVKIKEKQTVAKKSTCGDKQIRLISSSDKKVFIQFYYRGFFNTTKVNDRYIYTMDAGQERCFDLPESTYLSDRYVITASDIGGLKDSYPNKDVSVLVKKGSAFKIEKAREIVVTQ